MLACDDPPPVIVLNEGGLSPFLLLGDHAGRLIPKALGDLGVAPEAMDRHIAWDIGVAALGEHLSAALDAPFIRQAYSRLVYDCNRKPGAADAAPAISDGVAIPANANLTREALAARRAEIYEPYQAQIAAALDARALAGQPTIVVSLHSFTPAMQGIARPWHYGVLHRNDSPFSAKVLALLQTALGREAGDNQPYAMDEKDNTIPLHADPRGLDYLELEVRQDLLGTEDGHRNAAAFIAPILRQALEDETGRP